VEATVSLRRRVVPEQVIVAEIVNDAAQPGFEERGLADLESVGNRHHRLERAIGVE
jgi:hypothetical protein